MARGNRSGRRVSSVAIVPPWLIGVHWRAMESSLVREFFRTLPSKFDAEAAEDVIAVYQFDLSGPQGGQYHVEIKDGACSVREGTHPEPHVTFSMSGDDCLAVLSGGLDGPSVFLSGRLQISGD
ncbi:MAG: SCP2 sterol-binding domain-containing protein, partial [Nitrospiraceae bacterium]